MALVDYKRNFIFIHIYKTGGNSLREFLTTPGGDQEEIHGVHVEAKDLKNHFYSNGKEDFWDNAFKFTMIRNPYAWLVSTYEYIKRAKGHNYNKLMIDKPFSFFLNWTIDTAMKMDRPYGSNKYLTLSDFVLVDGEVGVDKIYRMEEFGPALQDLKKRLEIPLLKMPSKNIGNYKKDYLSYYDEKSIQLVQEHFGGDLSRFDYGLPIEGFNGDVFLREEVTRLIEKYNIKTVVETGTHQGNTTREFARMPGIDKVHTMEISKKFYQEAHPSLAKLKNVNHVLGDSVDILNKVIPRTPGPILFYLDAHWGPHCPLLDEIKTIAKHRKSDSVIVIHDFKVPDKPDFGFDVYKGQPFTWEWVKPSVVQVYGKDPNYHYNVKAAGAKRGVLFVEPKA